jgi:hypothetical protein
MSIDAMIYNRMPTQRGLICHGLWSNRWRDWWRHVLMHQGHAGV